MKAFGPYLDGDVHRRSGKPFHVGFNQGVWLSIEDEGQAYRWEDNFFRCRTGDGFCEERPIEIYVDRKAAPLLRRKEGSDYLVL